MRKATDILLKDLVHDFINKSGKQHLYSEQLVMDKWPEYVGEMCASQSKCVSVNKGILKVKVPNAALRFELNGRKSMIIDRINNDFSAKIITNILFL